jgi:hypothetical protein
MSVKATVTIAHLLPGRLRAYLSTAPADAERFVASITGHEGLDDVTYTDVSGSVLARYDTSEITGEEVAMRIAMALSLSMADAPVRIVKGAENRTLTNGAAAAGVLTGTAFVTSYWAAGPTARFLEKAAALATGGAVLQHGWREVREQGYFDPEVLSLSYLAASALRGGYARGALITWLMAFGRHLVTGGSEGVELRPVRQASEEGEPARYELVIAPGVSSEAPLFQVLQSLVRFLTLAGGGQTGLLNELRAVSTAHGEMVEGLGWMREDIPLHFR